MRALLIIISVIVVAVIVQFIRYRMAITTVQPGQCIALNANYFPFNFKPFNPYCK